MNEHTALTDTATDLTTRVLNSAYYGHDRHATINRVIEVLFKSYSAQNKDDDFSDFLLVFHQRIDRMITKYEFYGISFEHYLMRVARLSFIQYKMSRRQNTRHVSTCERYNARVLSVDMPRDDRHLVATLLNLLGVDTPPLRSSERRRLLILALKFSHWLSEVHIQQIALLIGYQYGHLLLLVETARLSVAKRLETRHTYIHRRNQLYSHLLKKHCEQHAAYTTAEDTADDLYIAEIARYRDRLQAYNVNINNNRGIPTNEYIATLLSIPKGTVDSSLYFTKKRYQQWQQSQQLGYTDGHEHYYCYQQYP